MKINILMSTYNGERFLAEQIQSIQRQTIQDWTLLVRDDGSTDKTLAIIQDFAKKDPRIHLINPDDQENLGVIQSFYTLLMYDKADVYFFSDQDDVWLDNKLELTLAEAQKHRINEPLLVYTDLKVVNQDLEVLHESMIQSQSHHANTQLVQELTENTVTGGTMMITHPLAKQWRSCKHVVMHDWYLALIAAAQGELVYLDTATELYRQHDANVLGARTWSKRLKQCRQPHKLIQKYWWLIISSQYQAKQLLDLQLKPADRILIEAYVGLVEKSFYRRLSDLKTYSFRKNRNFQTIIFMTLIITKFGYRRNKHRRNK